MVSVKKVARDTYFLSFKSQREMTKTLIRFQEYYENPKYMGQLFTLKEIENWWRKHNGGRLIYYSDWMGFNFPSRVLVPFYDSTFKRVTKRERRILDIFKTYKHPFYVVAAVKGDTETLAHELTHAMFGLNSSYRIKVNEVITKYKKKLGPLYRWLRKQGYAKDPAVLADEANAYLTCDCCFLEKEKIKYPKDVASKLQFLRFWYSRFMGHNT